MFWSNLVNYTLQDKVEKKAKSKERKRKHEASDNEISSKVKRKKRASSESEDENSEQEESLVNKIQFVIFFISITYFRTSYCT